MVSFFISGLINELQDVCNLAVETANYALMIPDLGKQKIRSRDFGFLRTGIPED